jgi:hypothetical protein
LFAFKFIQEPQWRGVFDEDPLENFFEKKAEYVDTSEQAQAIILPNNFTDLTEDSRGYIEQYADIAQQQGIPLFIFSFGDFTHELIFDERVWVFRLSTYKSEINPKDIVVPTTVRDFNDVNHPTRKKTTLPVVSFCGYAGFKTSRLWMSYYVKNAVWSLKALRNPIQKAHKLGIYWRRVAMRILSKSPLVTTHFIVRRSFSGALRTIELSPEQARKEFIDSILNADFVLTPKGDGNYSNRFLETIALSRIPVLIDTDTVLPFEDIIAYDSFVVTVPMNKVDEIATYIRSFYDSLTEDEWEARQRYAREMFETYLKQDMFFGHFFSAYFSSSKQ